MALPGPRLISTDTAVLIPHELPAGTQEPAPEKHAKQAGLWLYLHVHQQLPQVARRHHDGGVQLDDVALIQRDVVVSCQTLPSTEIKELSLSQ